MLLAPQFHNPPNQNHSSCRAGPWLAAGRQRALLPSCATSPFQSYVLPTKSTTTTLAQTGDGCILVQKARPLARRVLLVVPLVSLAHYDVPCHPYCVARHSRPNRINQECKAGRTQATSRCGPGVSARAAQAHATPRAPFSTEPGSAPLLRQREKLKGECGYDRAPSRLHRM